MALDLDFSQESAVVPNPSHPRPAPRSSSQKNDFGAKEKSNRQPPDVHHVYCKLIISMCIDPKQALSALTCDSLSVGELRHDAFETLANRAA